MKNQEWSNKEEKIDFDELFDKFNKMSQIKIVENQFLSDNKMKYHKEERHNNSNRYPKNNKLGFHKQSYNNFSKRTPNKTSANVKNNEFNGQKNKVISKNYVAKHNNCVSASQNIDENNETNDILKKISKEGPNNEKSSQLHKPDSSSNINAKFKKFESEFKSLGNLHRVTIENDFTYKKLSSGQKDKNNANLKWHNKQNRNKKTVSLNSDNQDSLQNHNNH